MNNKLDKFLKKYGYDIDDDLYNRIIHLLLGCNEGLYKEQNIFVNVLHVIISRNLSGDLREFYIKLRSFGSGVTLEKLKWYYGEEIGNQKWKAYKNKQAYTNSFEYKEKTHGITIQEFDDYNANRACTLNNLISRHGEELGNEKWKSYCERQAYAGCKQEYFIEKYGEVIGNKKWETLKTEKSLTLQTFQRKYGDIDGKERYIAYIDSRTSNYSKISQELFYKIEERLDFEHKSYFADKNKEFGKFRKDTGTYYKYDYVISDLKICIEFNGDIYHGNPTTHKPSDIPKFRGNKKTAYEIWQEDKIKNKLLEDEGFIVLVIWESDFRRDANRIIDKCVRIINEYRRK